MRFLKTYDGIFVNVNSIETLGIQNKYLEEYNVVCVYATLMHHTWAEEPRFLQLSECLSVEDGEKMLDRIIKELTQSADEVIKCY